MSDVTFKSWLEHSKKVSMITTQMFLLEASLGPLPAGALIRTLMFVGTDGGVELAAMDQPWLEGRCRSGNAAAALHVYLTVWQPEWKVWEEVIHKDYEHKK